jgi:hypothetical protein
MEDKSHFYPDEFNWWELAESCGDCRQPLHMASGQNIAFCPNCAIDNENAKNGRATLDALIAKMRLRKDDEHRRRIIGDGDRAPYWPEGVPL